MHPDTRLAPAPENSTNVRVIGWRGRALRLGFRALSVVVPPLAASLATRRFLTPARGIPSETARRVLAEATAFAVPSAWGRVPGWRWGCGPAVYLLHGWGGRGSQLGAFVGPLVSAGFTVVACDGPGHGESESRESSLLHLSGALRAVVAHAGPARAVIAHSLGGPACALAMRQGLAAERLVFVGAPADPGRYFHWFLIQLGVSARVGTAMKQALERRFGFRWADVAVARLVPGTPVPLLLIHDRDDAEVPWRDGVAIAEAWPGARLVTTTGLGHRGVLRDPDVVRRAVEFVAHPHPMLVPRRHEARRA